MFPLSLFCFFCFPTLYGIIIQYVSFVLVLFLLFPLLAKVLANVMIRFDSTDIYGTFA